MAFFAADAPAQFGAQHGVDLADLCGHVTALLGDGDEPHATIGGIGLAFDEPTGLELIDDGADGRSADAEAVGELGLRGGTELGDVAEQAGLGEVEVERGETGVEGAAHESGRRHQGGLHPQPRRCVEFVIGEVGPRHDIAPPVRGPSMRRRDPSGYILYVSLQRSPSGETDGDCSPESRGDVSPTVGAMSRMLTISVIAVGGLSLLACSSDPSSQDDTTRDSTGNVVDGGELGRVQAPGRRLHRRCRGDGGLR